MNLPSNKYQQGRKWGHGPSPAKDIERLQKWDLRPSRDRIPRFLLDRHNGDKEAAYKDYCAWIIDQRRKRLYGDKYKDIVKG